MSNLLNLIAATSIALTGAAGVPADIDYQAAPEGNAIIQTAGVENQAAPAGNAIVQSTDAQSVENQAANNFEFEASVLNGINQLRANYGLNPLTADQGFADHSRGWSQTLVDTGQFEHNPNRIGYAEIIANARTPEATVAAWEHSTAGHREIILSPNATTIGIGSVQGHDGRWITTAQTDFA